MGAEGGGGGGETQTVCNINQECRRGVEGKRKDSRPDDVLRAASMSGVQVLVFYLLLLRKENRLAPI